MAATYRLKIPQETAELIKGLHPELKRRLKTALKTILQDPYCGKALRDELIELRNFKVRRFRVIYSVVSDNMIEIVAIGPRKNIYRETFRLIGKDSPK